MKCCNCQRELSDRETYMCQRCDEEIDEFADQVMGDEGGEDG